MTRVDQEEVAGLVHDDVRRRREGRVNGRAAVTQGAVPDAVARDRRDHPGSHVDAADAIVPLVGDKEVPGGIECEAAGLVESGARRGTAVTEAVGRPPSTGDRPGETGGGVDAAHAVVSRVGHEEVAGGVHGHSRRPLQRRAGRGRSLAPEPGSARPRNRGQLAGRVDPEHPVQRWAGDVEVPRGVDRHRGGGVERGRRRRQGADGAGPGDRRDDLRRRGRGAAEDENGHCKQAGWTHGDLRRGMSAGLMMPRRPRRGMKRLIAWTGSFGPSGRQAVLGSRGFQFRDELLRRPLVAA